MALDGNGTQRIASPVSSGRTSPANIRSRKDDEGLAKRDKGYRRYASGIERVLSSFETTVEEWADYISFLGRLLKALQSKPTAIVDIPHRHLFSKRLSQCLNPVLPSGVHQKTLEVYAYIFSSLGRDGLSADLSLYLPGLTPVLSFAALSVKPAALAIFETYIVALAPVSLRPALKAIILALLPCLEDESAEEFERTLRIFSALKEAIRSGHNDFDQHYDISGDQYFWQCFFLAAITSTGRRPGALAYLTRKLPRLAESLSLESPNHSQSGAHNTTAGSSELAAAINAVASPEPGLLIRCFCAGLRDEQMLVQRGFLDLLVTHLPLHSTVLRSKVVPEDLERLISAAASVVARRDMSLNRRLWSWFLGPELAESNSASAVTPGQDGFGHQSRYFEKYGLDALIRTITKMIESEPKNPTERARPLRICLSLMDRWEIGGLVVPAIFLSAMESVWQYQSQDMSREATSEVLRSATMFFDGVESGLIWAEIIKLINQAFDSHDSGDRAACDKLKLLSFLITNFNIREEEMLVVHMPLASYVLLQQLQIFLRHTQKPHKGDSERVLLVLKITYRLLDLIPQRAFSSEQLPAADYAVQNDSKSSTLDETVLPKIQHFYTENQGNLDLEPSPLPPTTLGRVLLQSSVELVTMMLRLESYVSYNESDTALTVLNIVIRKVPKVRRPKIEQLLANLLEIPSESSLYKPLYPHFATVAAKVSTVETICTIPQSESWISESFKRRLLPRLVSGLWPCLSPSLTKHNVEAARCIWRLHTISTDKQLIESTISTLLRSHGSDEDANPIDIEDARRFTTLWTHSPLAAPEAQNRLSSLVRTVVDTSTEFDVAAEAFPLERPLMQLLDMLGSPQSSLFFFVVSWLQSLPNTHIIIGILIKRLSALLPFSTREAIRITTSEDSNSHESDGPTDVNLCLYYLQLILHTLQYSPNKVWPALISNDLKNPLSNAMILSKLSLNLLTQQPKGKNGKCKVQVQLDQAALLLLRHLLEGPTSSVIVEQEIEISLMEELVSSVEHAEHQIQLALLEVLLIALRMRLSRVDDTTTVRRQRPASRDHVKTPSTLSVSTESDDRKLQQLNPVALPPRLLHCLTLGISSPNSRPVLDGWIIFLHQCLPLYGEQIYQVLLRLVECFCNTLLSAFKSVQAIFESDRSNHRDTLEPTLGLLLNGLEQSLATAHDRLMTIEVGNTPVKSPEPQQQGFFGNMVSGVFSMETNRARTTTANNRLTVLLCFKDAVRVCFTIWSWGDQNSSPLQDSSTSATFNYTILRLRNRTRRIFEHLFVAEALECLETLIEVWQTMMKEESVQSVTVLNLLHVLEGTRPRNAIPAIFNAIYSRTNPGALDPMRKSTLTSDLSDTSLAAFLVAYAKSLDDDAMDEIWNDCMTFLKDVLANPMPHRQTLPKLLEFTATLGEKVDNTNFGEQRKMRRELGDLFVRLLTATLTIRPMGFSLDAPQAPLTDKLAAEVSSTRKSVDTRGATGPDGLISVLAIIAPNLSKVLIDSDRIASTIATISAQVIGPTFRSKTFPENINKWTLDLMIAMSSIPEASKAWKKDVAEAFNDSKFFSNSLDLAQFGWLPILRQWAVADKERMPELLSRLTSPTSAGIMFGVGASSARLEADRKTQLNLRRIAFLILAAAKDTFVVNLAGLQEKIVELLNATAASSPSSTTRAELYMVVRALLLKTSASHLAPLWPTINAELYDAISSLFPDQNAGTYNIASLLQACKLLDTLLTLDLDDFQMHEWLFITDTADAVYRSSNAKSIAMVDELAELLDSGADMSNFTNSSMSVPNSGKRRPLLTSSATKDVPKDELMEKVLRPFFRQLSIYTFESTYSMEVADWKACFDDLMADLFDDKTPA